MALINIYGDESSQNNHYFMVLGTIWQNPICSADLVRDVQHLKQLTNFKKHFHWNELKRHQLPTYFGLIELFKEYMDQGLLKFRAIVVDQTDRRHKIYSGDDELHFYKMYFWLIYRRIHPRHVYDIFLHRKENKVPGRLSDLKITLNDRIKRDYGRAKNVVRNVEPRDGTQIELQMADVFAGAIAYVKNGFYEERLALNPKNEKVQLVNHIESCLKLSLSSCHWPSENESFNIWCFRRN